MSIDVNVRAVTADDLEGVADVAARTFALACPPGAAPADIAAFIESRLTVESFAGYLDDPQRQVAVALADGVMVGYTMLIFEPPADDITAQLNVAPTAELSKIYVDPAHHGGGVARALLDDAVARVRAAGWPAVWLGTNQANERAQRFYEKNGFARVGTKRFRLGSVWEDDYIFELVLAPEPPR